LFSLTKRKVLLTKTLQVNFEHSAIDGHTALRFVSDIVAETIVVFAQSITKLVHGIGHVPHVINAKIKRAALNLAPMGVPTLDVFPKKLLFDLPDLVRDKIYFAETALGDEIVASDVVVLEYKSFGKSLIVANSLSPDAVVQMSIILAYYRLYGKIVCTYEPVLTKSFYHGRTEAQRSATPLAADFCHIWSMQGSTDEQKLEALRKATTEHCRLLAECAKGKGVDRHLFALQCIAEKNNLPTPEFFVSKPWKVLNHTILSTSNCGNPSLRLFGFGPGKFCSQTYSRN
jgi:carnitine O-acetyltransferase